jgi:hypothetical protein
MISIKVVLIQHMLDQSRFPDDLKTNLLREIARMDMPNVEVLLNKLRLCQKMQGSKSGPKLTFNFNFQECGWL